MGLVVFRHPSKLLKGRNFERNFEATFVEINLKKKKLLLSWSYSPQKSQVRKYLGAVGKNLDSYSSKYENFILLGDFNVKPAGDERIFEGL